MACPDAFQLFRLFQKAVPSWFFRELCQKHGYGLRQGIYSTCVVVWLMMWQRLQGNRSLTAAVQYLLQCDVKDLQTDCQYCPVTHTEHCVWLRSIENRSCLLL